MSTRWKRWIALLLLLLASSGALAAVGTVLCAPEPFITVEGVAQYDTPPGEGDCLLLQLAEVSAIPGALSAQSPDGVGAAAFVPPLAPLRICPDHLEPPSKPPAE
ncbi:MAG: hypothetical protein IPM22_16410 [Betaproteobacteria bacterium]|jgi:hypothetical protein|nr:hypothetical protein [Betaproteobacteria bacterium]